MIRYKKYIIQVLILILCIVWGVCFYDINKRFPKAQVFACESGEWLDYTNTELGYQNVQLSPESVKICNMDNLNRMYPDIASKYKDKGNDYNFIIYKFKIKNNGTQEISLNHLNIYTRAASYPTGWTNGGNLSTGLENQTIKSCSELEVTMYFLVSSGMVNELHREKFLNSQFQLCLKLYPEKVVLKFPEIEKYL